MEIEINHPEALAELEYLMKRLKLSADEVVERVLVEQGSWTPIETLQYPISSSYRHSALEDGETKL